MNISRSTFVVSLRVALPEFAINPDWLEDSLGYPIINDLARFTCAQAAAGDFRSVERALSFLEAALQGQDLYLRDLVLEFLETLRTCVELEAIVPYFGELTRDLWKDPTGRGDPADNVA